MDPGTFATLELDALVELLARHVQSPLGRHRALALSPSIDPAVVEHALDLTTESAAYLDERGPFGLGGLPDPERPLEHLGVEGTSLEALQIVALERLVAVAVDVRGAFQDPAERERYPRLAAAALEIPNLRPLLAVISGKILPTGEIDDRASPELVRLRRELVVRRSRVQRSLEALVGEQNRAVQEEIVTVRNGRFVIPLRTDSRSQIPGVMHGLSSSGQTSYVEPLSIIEANNELVRLREREQLEIARILRELSDALREHLPGIRSAAAALGELDLTQARARLAAEFACVRPRLSTSGRLVLRDVRHLLLERALRTSGGKVVPVSFEMDAERRTMVISGPNAGGKTVVLKTVGLAALMTQMGLHVPASDAELPVFRTVAADIGDQQSIAANLSTFTAHMRNVAAIAAHIQLPALLLLDEVGTGTDPDEGAALAIAIVEHLRASGAISIATTHYNPLKMWASRQTDVLNASVEFDTATLRPTYRLRVGAAGASSGLEIARRLDLPPSILERARDLVDPVHIRASEYLRSLEAALADQEALRAALDEERRATAEKFARLDLDFAQRETERGAQFEAELERVVADFRREADQCITSLKNQSEAARARKQAERSTGQLRRGAAARVRERGGQPADVQGAAPLRGPEPRPGDRVRVRSLGREGVLDAISGDTGTVALGALRFRARLDDLELAGAAPPAAPTPPRYAGPDLDHEAPAELQVIGLRADEAESRVDKFLDEAYLSGFDTVRIVHGHGKGVLRRVVAELLTGHPHVQSFQAAPADQGGGGATLVQLRKE